MASSLPSSFAMHEFWDALEQGHVTTVESWLPHLNLRKVKRHGEGAVTIAVIHGHQALVERLVQHDPSIVARADRARGAHGEPLLVRAVRHHHAHLIGTLLPHSSKRTWCKAFMVAAEACDVACVQRFLDLVPAFQSPDAHPRSSVNASPLMAAARGLPVQRLRDLMLDDQEVSPATMAQAQAAMLATVQALLPHSKTYSTPHRQPPDDEDALSVAIAGGHEAVVDLLLADSRLRPEPPGTRTRLMIAAEHGHLSILQKIAPFSDVAARHTKNFSSTAMHDALFNDDTACLRFLLSLGPPLSDSDGETLLMGAAVVDAVKCLDLLLPMSDVQATYRGHTALDIALRHHHWASADVLALAMDDVTALPEQAMQHLMHLPRYQQRRVERERAVLQSTMTMGLASSDQDPSKHDGPVSRDRALVTRASRRHRL